MNYLRIRLTRTISYLPNVIALAPYHFLKGLITILLRMKSSQIWFRNSLALDYCQAGLSDIDLSILVPTVRDAVRVTRKLKRIRMLSLGGESQVYVDKNLATFLPFANPFEIRRDPTLCERFGHHTDGTSAEKSLFLLKCLLSDGFLRDHPELREKRWRAMFKIAGQELNGKISREMIAKQIIHGSPIRNFVTANDLLRCLDETTGNTHDLNPLIFPNKIAWTCQDYVSLKKSLRGWPQEIHDWLHAFIRWEIWGLYPMTHLFSNYAVEGIFGHIENLRELLRHLPIPEGHKGATEYALSELSRHYRLACDEFESEGIDFGGANRT